MKKCGLSLAEIARQTGSFQPVLSRFYNGKRDLHLKTANRLAVFLGLELRHVRELQVTDSQAKAKKKGPALR
jgi:transcriptional regulator with XRE-family HTH domain